MKPFENVPAVVQKYTSEKIEPRNSESGGVEQQRVRDIVVKLALGDKAFKSQLDSVFPGVDHMMKAAAGKNDGDDRASAFKVSMDRGLPPLTIKMRNTLDVEVLSAVNVKIIGKPTLRVSAGVDDVMMTLRFTTVLTPEQVKSLEDHLSADLMLDMGVTQTTIES